MKRFYLLCLLVLISFPIQAKNKISMVTYFPVPYVAYSQVNTTEQMDIGLTSACSMKLGCSEESATLNATQVNLKGGKLNLDGGLGIKGYSLSLGSGYGGGKISFQNVRIQTGTMESVNSADIKAANLNLFGKTFPSCRDANIESGGQMQWASLKLKGASSNELYLICGALTKSLCEPSIPHKESYTETCWDRSKVTFTWDYDLCDYIPDRECPPQKLKRFMTNWRCAAEDISVGKPKAACVGPAGGIYTEAVKKGCASDCSVWKKPGMIMDPSVSVSSMHAWSKDLMKKYSIQAPCAPGADCPNCTVGQRYVNYNKQMYGGGCVDTTMSGYEEGSSRVLILVPYFECVEKVEHLTFPDARCQYWADGLKTWY